MPSDRLLEDKFIRRLSEVILLAFSFIIVVTPLIFDAFILGRAVDVDLTDQYYWNAFLAFIQFPYKTDLSAFITTVSGVVPVLLAKVCYQVDLSQKPAQTTDSLNKTGHSFFLSMILAATFSVIAIAMISARFGDLDALKMAENGNTAKGLFGSILSFATIYIAQLSGLKPK